MKKFYLKVRKLLRSLEYTNKQDMKENDTEVFSYDKNNFNLIISNESEYSNFDILLKKKWTQIEKDNVLHYSVKSQRSKILDGKYKFYAQLNIDRATKRRKPEEITSMFQSFDPNHFNFMKISPKEILFDVGNGDGNDIIAVNVSPIVWSHSLLLPQRFNGLPQAVTLHSFQKAMEMFLLSSSINTRVVFNSLCANASVNHLHWHIYYLDFRMLLECIPLKHLTDSLYILEDFPAKGYCIKFSSFKEKKEGINEFVKYAFNIVSCLQKNQIAHNIYITRSKTDANEKNFDDIRIYIWARAQCHGSKDTEVFIIAACEVFGHLQIRSEEAFNNLTEEYVSKCLEETTKQAFLDSQDKLVKLLNEKKEM